MQYGLLLEKISTEVKHIYLTTPHASLYFHDLNHLMEVHAAAEGLMDHYTLNERDRFIISAAIWFHDLGYLDGVMDQHEARSAEKANQWLEANGVPEDLISAISGCILATKMPQNPTNLLEQIICDADLWQLGTDQFSSQHKLLRKELEEAHGKTFDTEAWRRSNINLLSTHRYHTDFAQQLLGATKQQHLQRLQEKLTRQEERAANPPEKKKKAKENETTPKSDPPTRGIETMFRLTMSNHMELSSMADAKANIMISVNAIIVSVVLSVLLRRFEEYPRLILPTILLLLVNVTTIVFAVLSVRPRLIGGSFTDEDIRQRKANLLFFGNFHKSSMEQYQRGMNEMMHDREYLYGSMTRNIYFLGVVLGRKYKLLRMAYTIFMYGFVIAVAAFAIASL